MPTWFLVKSKFQKETEDGSLKTFSEQHLFDAVSWTNAETRFFGTFQVAVNDPKRTITAITPMKLSDLIGDDEYSIWFKVKFHYQAETESGKVKKVVNTMLVNANNLEDARKLSEVEFEKWMIECHIDSIIETPILDVFPYSSEEEEPQIPGNFTPGQK
jgi:hypothetical protein